MINIHFLTPELRIELKEPIGLLITGSYTNTTEKLNEIINKKKPTKVIAVGDRVSRNIIRKGIHLDVSIVDNRVNRKIIPSMRFKFDKTFHVVNPAGMLTNDSWKVINEALECIDKKQVKIVVEGEEDLLSLIAAMKAPNGSIIVYGQPKKGIVVMYVTEKLKKRIKNIIDRMDNKKY